MPSPERSESPSHQGSDANDNAAPELEIAIWNRHEHRQGTITNHWSLKQGRLTPLNWELDDHLHDIALEMSFDQEANTWLLHNHGPSLRLDGGRRLAAGQTQTITLPFTLQLEHSLLECFDNATTLLDHQALEVLPATAGDAFTWRSLGSSPAAVTLAHWLDAIGELQRLATGTGEYLQACASAAIDPGGLDAAFVLGYEQDEWRIQASRIIDPQLGIGFSKSLAELARTTGQTHYSNPDNSLPTNCPQEESPPEPIRFAIAAPFFNDRQQVAGVLYGMRRPHRQNSRRGIRPLEAQFISLLADVLSAGFKRRELEKAELRKCVLLEQAFSPSVAQQLLESPDILKPQRRVLSLLFADLRDSTRLTQQLSPQDLYAFLGELLDDWTQCVVDLDGVVLDYFGDGLAAFWNAPIEQPDHAALACLAGWAMLERIPDLGDRWRKRLPSPPRIGIGIHTGNSWVGNSGSRRRLKFGPRGEAIHVSNRLEAATKSIGVPLLISAATAQQLPNSWLKRRIARVHLPGVDAAFDVYEPLSARSSSGLEDLAARYEQALKEFEQGHWASSLAHLNQLLADYPPDPASQWLKKWVQQHLAGDYRRRATDKNASFVPLPNESTAPLG